MNLSYLSIAITIGYELGQRNSTGVMALPS